MQYPLNAIMLGIGQFTATMIDMVGIWALFYRFGALDGWRLGDIAMFFGLVSVSFSIADFSAWVRCQANLSGRGNSTGCCFGCAR
jgi:ABC-2 type transport system permease protein